MFKAREVLLYFAIIYEGDYERILDSIRNKVKIDEGDYRRVITSFSGDYFTIVDEVYPERFKKIYRPPLVVFYHGDFSLVDDLSKAISVVGTRNPSDYGEKMAAVLVDGLVANDYLIISGMAKGIDAVAHQRALDSGGKTIAVLGSGINNPYPRQNEELYKRIIAKGLILSEYPDKVKPNKENFPARNRLVAALSDALLVVEASYRSGTLITVGASLANGGDIFCVPARAGELSGTNQLIKDGAYLVETVDDIINLMPKHKNN